MGKTRRNLKILWTKNRKDYRIDSGSSVAAAIYYAGNQFAAGLWRMPESGKLKTVDN